MTLAFPLCRRSAAMPLVFSCPHCLAEVSEEHVQDGRARCPLCEKTFHPVSSSLSLAPGARIPKANLQDAGAGASGTSTKPDNSPELNGAQAGKSEEPTSSVSHATDSQQPERDPWRSFTQGSRLVWVGML